MALPRFVDMSINMGCDPEFFLKLDGEVIGAEKIIPKAGLHYGNSKIIIDGVQAELNPRPNTCRGLLGNEIAACFRTLEQQIKAKNRKVTCDFSRTVEISKENLMELDEKSRKFGCAESQTIYAKLKAGLKLNKVDPTEYRTRAAGGHIHLDKVNYHSSITRALTTDHKRTVAILDLVCANTAVLVDRDDGNIERRKMYGRAGEFRLPKHGLEYRTLSNFWLTSSQLFSFAFGMTRLAVLIMAQNNHEELYKELTSLVPQSKVHKAINNNDFDLAMDNFTAIEPLLLEIIPASMGRYPIEKSNITKFHHFVKMIRTKGLTYWFPEPPMQHWVSLQDAHRTGFYDFLHGAVHTDMKTKKAA